MSSDAHEHVLSGCHLILPGAAESFTSSLIPVVPERAPHIGTYCAGIAAVGIVSTSSGADEAEDRLTTPRHSTFPSGHIR